MTKGYETSSGNVFADLGFEDSEQELLKAKLTLQIHKIITARKLTQNEAAKLLGTTQPQMSALMRCKPVSVSVGRLMEFLTVLGQDVRSHRQARRQAREGGAYDGRRRVSDHVKSYCPRPSITQATLLRTRVTLDGDEKGQLRAEGAGIMAPGGGRVRIAAMRHRRTRPVAQLQSLISGMNAV